MDKVPGQPYSLALGSLLAHGICVAHHTGKDVWQAACVPPDPGDHHCACQVTIDAVHPGGPMARA